MKFDPDERGAGWRDHSWKEVSMAGRGLQSSLLMIRLGYSFVLPLELGQGRAHERDDFGAGDGGGVGEESGAVSIGTFPEDARTIRRS